jgi:hypothetical protein
MKIDMKKIIGILAVLFIATGVFGQKFIRHYSLIELTPNGINAPQTTEDWIRSDNVVGGDYDWISYVHFVRDGKLYMLAYEPVPYDDFKAGVDRDIYLYCKDTNDVSGSWSRASERVTTAIWRNTHNYTEFDLFRKDKSRGSKGEVYIEGNQIYITIGMETMTNGRVQINEPITYGFRPSGDSFYHVFLKYQKVDDNGSSL